MEENLYFEISNKYNLSFKDALFKIDGLQGVYAFGGTIRDFLLKREWKEVDVRIVLNKEHTVRENLVENALSAYDLQGKTQIEHLNLTVYRFLPTGSKTNEPIDLSLVPTLEDNLPDFTINSIFFDLNKKVILDRFDGIDDLENKIIRTVKNSNIQFQEEPHMMFRAIKFACQLDFDIENETGKSIKELSILSQKTLNLISETKQGIFVELFLGNIFKGLKSDPKKYYSYMKEFGLYDQFVVYAAEKTGSQISEVVYPINDYGDFEKNISHFFSCIINSLNLDNKNSAFELITNNLAITTPKEYSDFVVNTSKISYIC